MPAVAALGLCLALACLAPTAASHGEGATTAEAQGDHPGASTDLWTPGAVALAVLVLAMGGLVVVHARSRAGRARTGPWGPAILLVVLVLAAYAVLALPGALDGGSDAGDLTGHVELGPATGPGHMAAFYEAFDPELAPHAEDIVGDPAAVPPAINAYPDPARTLAHLEPAMPQVPRLTPVRHHVTLTAQERVAPLTEDATYHYWTYDGQVPGPMLRVRQGDEVVITLENEAASTHPHSIDLHAVEGPGGGASATQVDPGETATLRFTAHQPGLFVYHCGTPNVAVHVANQMFGLILVEPELGLPAVDAEFVVAQGELYAADEPGPSGFLALDVDKLAAGTPTHYTFNGRPAGLTGEHALAADAGDVVRVHFANVGNAHASAFHVIGEVFDRVWASGSLAQDPEGPGVQTVLVPPGGAAVVDFRVETAGHYVLVDHGLGRLDLGAWGLLHVGEHAHTRP